MARYRLMTMVNAKDGRDAEMNAWYDGQHVPDLLSVPGVISAQRFRVHNPLAPTEPLFRYVNIFEIEGENPMEVFAEVSRRTAAGEFPLTDSIELISMGTYEALGEQVKSK